ncbi:fructose-1,6-bisphosphatase [Candidatus Peribacteria bacterium]|nr:fructose-1,6-bisphosphatase [Candidatus Peribacteria bacterium]
MSRISLNNHLYESGVSDELRHLINDISRAGKYIHNAIRTTDLGLAGSSNTFGEEQLKLDVLSNDIVKEELKESRLVCCYASEEESSEMTELLSDAPFTVVFDPLDGSSLLDCNLAIGSIFGIYESKGKLMGKTPRDQVAALYLVYGPRTILVYSTGKGVHAFYLNEVGEFTLLEKNLTMKDEVKTYAPGNLRAVVDTPSYRTMMNLWLDEGLTLRYSGGMVPDIHHMLIKGAGIFTNIGGSKYPKGKLRLLYECGPFAYIMEQAGGASSDGTKSVLDVEITDLDQRTPIITGAKKEVKRVSKVLNE